MYLAVSAGWLGNQTTKCCQGLSYLREKSFGKNLREKDLNPSSVSNFMSHGWLCLKKSRNIGNLECLEIRSIT